jgi:CelD/BcsL family acetyltransferase involved in cellulose biosynthesis
VFFVAAYSGERLRAVFPLRRCRPRLLGIPFHALELPEYPHMVVGDFLLGPGGAGGALATALIAYLDAVGIPWHFLRLRDVFAGAGAAAVAEGVRGLRRLRRQSDSCHSIPIVQGDAMEERFPSKLRSNLRNRARRLAKIGSAEFVPAANAGGLADALADFLAVEAAGWKGRAGTAVAQHPRLVSFYRRLAASFGASGRCHVNRLTLDGKSIAAQFCLVTDGTCFQLKFAYDEAHASLAPGDLLLDHCFRWYAGHPDAAVTRFNFLSGAPMFDKWRPDTEPVYTIHLFRPGQAGALAATLLGVRSAAGRLLRRRPARTGEDAGSGKD